VALLVQLVTVATVETAVTVEALVQADTVATVELVETVAKLSLVKLSLIHTSTTM
jgi:hypothetical protein